MSLAAILGAGPIGSAVAQWLAERARFRSIRFIDATAAVAAGKALDLRQSGPIDRVDVDLTATDDVLAAAGASVIVVADAIDTGEWQGETGLALIRQLARAGTNAPLVFAGPGQTSLIETVVAEIKWPSARLLGSAAGAVPSAVRALAGVELGRSGADVDLVVVGRPPALVVGWSSATASGSLVTEQVPPHRLRAISDGIGKLWPPGPQAIGAATARLAEALAFGSRQLHQALTVPDGEVASRGRATLLPLELGNGRILRRVLPTLSSQERTASGL